MRKSELNRKINAEIRSKKRFLPIVNGCGQISNLSFMEIQLPLFRFFGQMPK